MEPVEVRIRAFLGQELGALGRFDRVVMNPPFEKRQDEHHALYAAQTLRAGGRLVAIVTHRAAEALKPAGFTKVADLESGTFQGSEAIRQTGVRSCIVVYDA